MTIVQPILGILAFVLLLWVLSENRRDFSLVRTGGGLAVQVALAFLLLKVDIISDGLLSISNGIKALLDATQEGTKFCFGFVGNPRPDQVFSSDTINTGALFSLAFHALPMIIVVSALSMLLFKWRVLPLLVSGCSFVFRKIMGIGGALGVCGGANIFLGQTESPLLIRPYLTQLSRSEFFTVMCMGMATTSGTILVIYAQVLGKLAIGEVIQHLII